MSTTLDLEICPPPLPIRKRRRAVTDVDRKKIRDYYYDDSNLKPTYKAISKWLKRTESHDISESTICHILSDRFTHLDNSLSSSRNSATLRHRAAYWPDLEISLFEWQQRMQRKNATITGDILKGMAEQFWLRLPQYQEVEMPKWSAGWLDGFKTRHKIKKYIRHGEAGGVNRTEVEEELVDLRKDLEPYPLQDIFNMDKTALY